MTDRLVRLITSAANASTMAMTYVEHGELAE
jgi:hypothetical protein